MRQRYGILALIVIALAIGYGLLRRTEIAEAPVSGPESRPNPFDEHLARPPVHIVSGETVRTRVADTVHAADKSPATTEKDASGTDWAVVAAIYKEYEPAERRARDMSEGSAFKAAVFPDKGKGSKYMVVLQSQLTYAKASQIRERAVSGGMPADTYVTRLNARE